MATDPRYKQYIERDPFYQQRLADLSAGDASALANAQAQARRLYILFGGNIGGIPEEWIDEQTRSLAAQNTTAGLSTTAQLGRTHERNIEALQDALAARGMLRSGELGRGLEDENHAYEQARYDKANDLAAMFAGIQKGYADALQQSQQGRAAAATDAYGRVVDQYGGTLPPAPGSVTGPVAGALASGAGTSARIASPRPAARPTKQAGRGLYGLNQQQYRGRSF